MLPLVPYSPAYSSIHIGPSITKDSGANNNLAFFHTRHPLTCLTTRLYEHLAAIWHGSLTARGGQHTTHHHQYPQCPSLHAKDHFRRIFLPSTRSTNNSYN
ncbi:hypothetical protein E2C01_083951 [Portunus trituberculatus]|uniref:Uncharacterized protein n=1 Tax=Portunus trituberculatus TaxID=210409 RepID=A0A5B7J3K6_PORTR|nr:hypothetical protein [Portunus trituberculatus]